jgi:hypothetical protein
MITLIASMVTFFWQINLLAAIIADLLIKVRRSKNVWLLALVAVGGRAHQEMWPIIPVAILINAVRHWHGGDWYMVFFDMLALWNWWVLRNFPGDDNQWKRRAKKARDAVAVRGSRLVVVPT